MSCHDQCKITLQFLNFFNDYIIHFQNFITYIQQFNTEIIIYVNEEGLFPDVLKQYKEMCLHEEGFKQMSQVTNTFGLVPVICIEFLAIC